MDGVSPIEERDQHDFSLCLTFFGLSDIRDIHWLLSRLVLCWTPKSVSSPAMTLRSKSASICRRPMMFWNTCIRRSFWLLFSSLSTNSAHCLVVWGCRIHRLHLCRGVKPSPTSILDMTLNNLMVRLWNVEHPFTAIAPRFTLARSGNTW